MPYFHDINPIAFTFPAFPLVWYTPAIAAILLGILAWIVWRRPHDGTSESIEARKSTVMMPLLLAAVALIGCVYMLVEDRRFVIGPIGVHWYGIMYLLGFAGAWILGNSRRRRGRLPIGYEAFSDLAFYVMLGVIVGGRIGYMMFYADPWVMKDPLAILRVWEGGMSFHGGLMGVLFAGWLWSRKNKIHFFDAVDFVAPLVPIGLGLGRLGNFIGGELWGRRTDLPWGVIFPRSLGDISTSRDELYQMYLAGQLNHEARHPSQLYEFALEGIVMFTVLWLFSRKPRPRYAVSGLFALMYGCFRFGIEFVREPDAQLGYIAWGWLTMGQILSIPLIIVGIVLLWMSRWSPTLSPKAEVPIKESA